jgi:hypothetical protein
MFKTIVFLILALICFVNSVAVAQQPNNSTLGWDLSYTAVQKNNNLDNKTRLSQWSGRNPQSLIKRIISEWQEDPILSSVLIEYPAFREDKKISIWFVRTKKNAYYWYLIDTQPAGFSKKPFDKKLFDKLYKEVNSWKQASLLPPQESVAKDYGYFGILSLYKKGKSRQMLLSADDFFAFADVNRFEVKPGRLTLIIDSTAKQISPLLPTIFGNCKNKPTKISLSEMFGKPIECQAKDAKCINFEEQKFIDCPPLAEGIVCFDGKRTRLNVSFDKSDFVESVVMGGDSERIENIASRLIPGKSWVQFITRRYAKKPIALTSSAIYQEKYEDECLTIESGFDNKMMTDYIPFYMKISWK